MLLNQCIKLGMPDKKHKNHSQSPAHSPSKTNQVHLKSKISQVSSQSRPEQNLSPSKTSPVFTHSRMGHVQLQSRASQVQSQSKTGQSRPLPYNQISSKRHQISTRSCNSFFHSSKDCSKNSKEDVNKSGICKLEKDVEEEESDLLQQCIQLGMPTKTNNDDTQTKGLKNNTFQRFNKDQGYRDNRPDGTSDVEDDDDDILLEYINAGKPKQAVGNKDTRQQYSSLNKSLNCKPSKSGLQYPTQYGSNCSGKPQSLSFSSTKKVWPPPFIPDDDCMTASEESPCVYKTEDTPVLSPTASISDLSTLSFSEEKNGPRSHLNNSRNSDCSSDSDEDDELLLQCIQSGMPASKRAVA